MSTELDWKRGRDSVVFQNKGNVSAELIEATLCQSGAGCMNLPSNRMFVGTQWSLSLPPKASFRAVKKTGKRFEQILVPAYGSN